MTAKLGVLGGMGPMATLDFQQKLIAATPAKADQEHITTLVYSICHAPDRTAAILGTGPSPLPELLAGLEVLQLSRVECIAMPCNTAHYWYPQLAAASSVPIFHIVDTVCESIRDTRGTQIGVLATAGTIASRVYQDRLEAYGFQPLVPDRQDLDNLVMPAIRKIKSGDLPGARQLLIQAGERLLDRGATRIILGCTELPLAPQRVEFDLVDAADILVRKCVDWWFAQIEMGKSKKIIQY